ncbi:MAG TPA: peptidylprolyl isomerase [Candidatus Methylacidiphilales bacterium]|jgi:cyclophilin family peptidyl-prolyl cis-trans isomerase|nr:peptidylprolyl isomerase [Candidatus Methylacidiphilales bacterium]
MKLPLFALCLGLFLPAAFRSACADTYVRFNTSLGYIDVDLFSNATPNTVANFLSYVDSGAYANSIIHRSVPGFVIQGGGYFISDNTVNAIPAGAPVASEAGISNTRGTIAMALTANSTTGVTDPNSGTNEWFFNEVDNNSSTAPANLDAEGFTVFGTIMNANGLSVMDQINSEPTYDASSLFGSAFTQLPLINYNSTVGLELQNFISIYSITLLTVQDFATWQSANFTTQQQGNPAYSGPNATPLNDGVPNLFKYLFDINPTVPMAAADRAKLPAVGTTTIGGTPYMTLTYNQCTALVGVTVNVQTSPDLQNWTTVTNPTFVQTGSNSTTGDPIIQVQVPVTGAKQFIRLNVTQS